MLIADIIIAILPIYAYYHQLLIIRSFSIYVCAFLLVSNILRVFFWILVGFALSLLIQSLLVITIMLILLKECVQLEDHFIKDTSIWKNFWKWQTYRQYLNFLVGLVAVLVVITFVIQIFTFGYFGQLIGLLALGIEAALGIPQLISNWRSKSVQGLSRTMITLWFLGDFAKTIYFIAQAQPFQFVVCGAIQLTVDILLILQILNYTDPSYDSLDNSPLE